MEIRTTTSTFFERGSNSQRPAQRIETREFYKPQPAEHRLLERKRTRKLAQWNNKNASLITKEDILKRRIMNLSSRTLTKSETDLLHKGLNFCPTPQPPRKEEINDDNLKRDIHLCDTTFELRYRNHVCSFKNEQYKHATELSKYIWSLKDKGISYNIKWRKVKQARSYSSISRRCNLCLWEGYFIICKPEMSTLNNRSELISNCRHSKKFLLKNVFA